MSRRAIAAAVAFASLGACVTPRPVAPTAAAAHWRALTILGPLEAGLLYHQWGGTEPDPRLAFAWGDICGEPDPVAREAAVAAARHRLRESAADTAERRAWRLPLRHTLGAYDLERGGFATPLRTGAVVRFDRSDFCQQEVLYLVAFRNGDAHAVLGLSEEAAKQFIRANPSRSVILDVEIEPVGWRPGPPGPTLLVDIVRVRTRDAQSDAVLRDTAVPGSP